MSASLILWAQEGGGGGGFPSPLIFMMGVLFFAYIFLILPGKRRQERERAQLLASMTKNDKIVTIGGIFGTVVTNNEQDEHVTIKVEDGTKIKMLRTAIARNITKEDELKQQKESGSTESASPSEGVKSS